MQSYAGKYVILKKDKFLDEYQSPEDRTVYVVAESDLAGDMLVEFVSDKEITYWEKDQVEMDR